MSQPSQKRVRPADTERKVGVSSHPIDAEGGVVWTIKGPNRPGPSTFLIPQELFGRCLRLPSLLLWIIEVTEPDADIAVRYWQDKFTKEVQDEAMYDDIKAFEDDQLINRYFVNVGYHVPSFLS